MINDDQSMGQEVGVGRKLRHQGLSASRADVIHTLLSVFPSH